MNLFRMPKPRGFNHNYIYYDERRARLREIEERARRELGRLPEAGRYLGALLPGSGLAFVLQPAGEGSFLLLPLAQGGSPLVREALLPLGPALLQAPVGLGTHALQFGSGLRLLLPGRLEEHTVFRLKGRLGRRQAGIPAGKKQVTSRQRGN